jgi:tRNA modification GTPase
VDTIFALASAPGRAGVAVIRVSGPDADLACRTLAGRLPPFRRASLCRLRDQLGDVLDEALVLRFAGVSSFTGEPVVEFHCHGSRAVIAAVLQALAAVDGLRPAEAGEFTRRALENDRLDLSQVEGLADLIDAETEAQRRQAMRALGGAMAKRVESWRQRLLRAAALVEATIDFADEDIPMDVWPEVLGLLDGLIEEFQQEVAGAIAAERVREGFEVAIIGPPNVGKSTLLNRLAGREAAITSSIAGTTRDIVEVRMEVAGQAVTFVDTAGLRESQDEIEAEGIRRARQRAQEADLRIVMGGGGDLVREGDLVLHPKADLGGHQEGIPISGLTGEGVDVLLRHLADRLFERWPESGVATRNRHAAALQRGEAALVAARDEVETGASELVAAHVGEALRAVESVTGRVGVEDLLGEIFASFCIGK